MKFSELHAKINRIKDSKLPGEKAHQKMMDLKIRNQIFKDVNHKNPPKESAVLCLIYPDEKGHSKMVFILRKKNNGNHSGQISFPGGKKEKQDRDGYDTALREAKEEIGIDPRKVELIKKLSRIFIPISNYKVNAYLAISKEKPAFIKQEEEVEKILELDLEDFIKLPRIEIKKKYFGKEYPLYAFQSGKWIIWGATAMILSEIVEILKEIEKN